VYDIDYTERGLFDAVIDTSELSQLETAERVLEEFSTALRRRGE
jgi:hypothetical protein